MQLNENSLIIYAIALGLLGLVECFFGYRFFRIILAIVGFFVGVQLGAALFSNTQGFVLLLVEIVIGILGAVLFYFLYFVGFLIAGLSLGASIGTLIAANFNLPPDITPILIVIGAVIGGILGFFLSKYIIMIGTALLGAAQLMAATLLLFLPETRRSLNEIPQRLGQGGTLLATVVIFVLAILGFIVQFRTEESAPRQETNAQTQ